MDVIKGGLFHMLEIGTKAPDFELPDQNGEKHKLSDYAGKKVILYFYPRIVHQDVRNRLVVFQKDIPSLPKKEQLFWA